MKRFGLVIVLLAFASLILGAEHRQIEGADFVDVSVKITHVLQVENPDTASGDGDYFANVSIDGQAFQHSAIVEDDDFAPTDWVFTRTVDRTGPIDITIQLRDEDGTPFNGDDDIMDIDPHDGTGIGAVQLNIRFNAFSGRWDVAESDVQGTVARGDGGDHGEPEANDGRVAEIQFQIYLGTVFDLDGDGIGNAVEVMGVRNSAGALVKDLGTSPCKKSIPVWIDWMADGTHSHQPKAGAITLVQNMYGAAPLPGVTPCPYNGEATSSGVEWIVEGGRQVAETQSMVFDGTFNAARDTGPGNMPDELDPYVHYIIFGHQQSATSGSSGLCCGGPGNKDLIVSLGTWDTGCVSAGADGILSTPVAATDVLTPDGLTILVGTDRICDSTALNTAGPPPLDDVQIVAVGSGDFDGDTVLDADVGTLIEQAGTIVHELGHAIGLPHGGNPWGAPPNAVGDPTNFKPQYLSAMNYAYQMGIAKGPVPAGACCPNVVLDYSRSALPTLTKATLNENNGVTGAAQEWIRWTDPTGAVLFSRVGPLGEINWDNDVPVTYATVNVDINSDDGFCIVAGPNNTLQTSANSGDMVAGTSIVKNFVPSPPPDPVPPGDNDCDTTAPAGDDWSSASQLIGAEDWTRLRFRGADGAGAGASNAAPHTVGFSAMTYEERLEALLNFREQVTPQIEIKKEVIPAAVPGTFNLQLDNTTLGTGAHVANGGTTGVHDSTGGPHTIGETADPGNDVNHFEVTITCLNPSGVIVASGTGPTLGITFEGGERWTCTIKNHLPIPDECLTHTYKNFIFGTPGNDTINGTPDADIIIGYAGKDKIDGRLGDDCIAGGPGEDTLNGGQGADIIAGDDGKDTIDGGTEDDIIHGGQADDTIEGGNGNDLIYGENGSDTISGGNDDDTILGGKDADNIKGVGGNDLLYGNDGSDTLNGGAGLADRCSPANGGPPAGETISACEVAAPNLP